MEHQTSTNKWQIIAKFSLIYALIMIALNLILFITDTMESAKWFSLILTTLVVTGSMYFGILSLRNNVNGGFISYGKSFSTGMWIAVFAALMLTIYQIVFVTIIDPDFTRKMLIELKKQLLEKKMSEEQLQTTLHFYGYLTKTWVLALSAFITHIFIGLFASLIVSIFTQKEDPESEYNSLQSNS